MTRDHRWARARVHGGLEHECKLSRRHNKRAIRSQSHTWSIAGQCAILRVISKSCENSNLGLIASGLAPRSAKRGRAIPSNGRRGHPRPGRFTIDVGQLSRHPGTPIRMHSNIARCRLVSPYRKICSGVHERNRSQYNLAKKWFKHRTIAGLPQSATFMTDHSFKPLPSKRGNATPMSPTELSRERRHSAPRQTDGCCLPA
ncbi:uncharacterized protein BDZ83DRAFT_252348 [Colletotrichum acutatum]|uniref:Uncharacterized protein n=1 Tax=Glomerella acutata TaxID=27357 RepID=A0AAD8UPY1_GLOAC|nr:uncharacterized protein BDZ83DRAFT_252348 [Colletotrichum acutatum]KAK1726727.1 hypothetical protein BDZ83DRAFT_252348 [Colletotrichum acutatum]